MKATSSAVASQSGPEDVESAAIERLLLLEIDAHSRLRHPNIAGFLGACFDDPAGCVFLVRELPSAAGTLARALAAGRAAAAGCGRCTGVWAPPRRQVARWVLQLAQALNYLHQCSPRVAHGDLGPACLLLSALGELKVLQLSAPGEDRSTVVSRRASQASHARWGAWGGWQQRPLLITEQILQQQTSKSLSESTQNRLEVAVIERSN